jgi:hypothetical protein
MAKSKRTSAPDSPPMPQVGDRVYPPNSQMLYEISHVHVGGDEVNLHVPGTNLERFRVRTDRLTFVDRKPPARTSNPFTNPEPVFDAGEMLERIETVQRDSLKRVILAVTSRLRNNLSICATDFVVKLSLYVRSLLQPLR